MEIYQGKNKKLCPSCHKEVQIEMKFCPNCGSKIEKTQNLNLKLAESKTKREKIALIPIITATLVVTSVLYSILDKRTPNNSSGSKITKTNMKPDSTQCSIINKAGISFEELKKIEKYTGFRICNILVGYIQPYLSTWAPLIKIEFGNNLKQNVKPNNAIQIRYRFRFNNKVLGSNLSNCNISFDEDIFPNMRFECESVQRIETIYMPKEKTFVDLLDDEGNLITTITIPNTDVTEKFIKSTY